MEKELLKQYRFKKNEIEKRLNEFERINNESSMYKEFLFCLLTPQSKAKKCWEAVEQLSKLSILNLENITNILKSKTRFHNTKANRILSAEETWKKVLPLLKNQNKLELRNQIAEIVNGYGLKEAGHFLRNIGHSKNQFSILDRHILRNLKAEGVIKEEKIKSKKSYLEIEQSFLNFADSIKIPADHLDLLWWSQENGEIFK